MTTVLHDQAAFPPPGSGPPGRRWYQRAALIVPLVLVVVAVVLTAVVVMTRSGSTVGGTPQAPAVASDLLRANVTSALTGASLAVTLKLPDGTSVPVQPNGVATATRIKPGDQVEINADGYVAVQIRVSTDRTITATLQPTFATVLAQLKTWAKKENADAIANWVFSPATGLRFTTLEDGSDTDDVPWSAAREVVGKIAIVDAVLLSGTIEESTTVGELFEGKATPITLAGQPAWHGPLGDGAGSIWIRSSLLIEVSGIDLSTTDEVLAAMIAAQPAQ